MKLLYSLALLALCYSCSPKVGLTLTGSRPPLEEFARVEMLDVNDPAPDEAERIGRISLGGGKNGCRFEEILPNLHNHARKAGGNLLKVLRHRVPPKLQGGCHHVIADIFYMEDLDNVLEASERAAMRRIDTALYNDGCAIIHFYRPSASGFIVGYDICVGEEAITRARDYSKESVMVKATGPTTFWAKTEAKVEIEANILPGRHYYVRCGISPGIMVGRPALMFVSEEIGRPEYDSINTPTKIKD